MAGLKVVRSKKSLILEIPTKDRGILRYFTSISGMAEMVAGKRAVVYFNPKSDFARADYHA